MKKGCVLAVSNVSIPSDKLICNLRRILKQSELLLEMGFEIILIAPRKRGETKVEIIKGVKIIRIFPLTFPKINIPYWDDFFSYSIPLLIAMFFLVIFKHVRLIHSHNPPDMGTLVSNFIGTIFKIPVIHDMHDLWVDLWITSKLWNSKSLKAKFGRMIEKINHKKSKIIFVVSKTMKKVLIEREIPAYKVFIIRQPCDLELFDPRKYDGIQIKNKLKMKEASPLIVYIGELELIRRGLEILIESMVFVLKELPQAKLLLIGIGSGRNKLELLTEDLGLSDAIIFTGWINHKKIPEYLAAADILVSPFLNTSDINISAPHKIYEYMAMEKPIVVTSILEFRNMLKSAAIFAEPGNPKDLAKSLLFSYTNPDITSRYAKKARQLLVERYSWTKTTNNLVKIYKSTLH